MTARTQLLITLCSTLALGAGCGSDSGGSGGDETPNDGSIRYAGLGSLSEASGVGSFRFGAASAAAQIEDQNVHTDWYAFTAPEEMGGVGRGTFVGDAVRGYSLAQDDIQLLVDMNLDSYRFSMSWARIEPQRDQIDEAALQHYSDFIDALIAAGIRPTVTVHHFSNPVWLDDPRDTDCESGPSDANLCGWGHPQGGPMIVEEMAEFAQLLGERFGDRVDDWATVNEPVNYLIAGHGAGIFPPGKLKILSLLDSFIPVIRDYIDGHAAMYKALKAADTVDVDGDGSAASVGLTLSAQEWVPARFNEVSDDPIDVEATQRIVYAYHYLLIDSLLNGNFDSDLDGTPDEQQPDWQGTLDWLGVQYYFRTGVTGNAGLIPAPLSLTPCFAAFDGGACLPPLHPNNCVPSMKYEYWAPGLYNVLSDFAQRWPGLPMMVSESGIATEVGARRAENIVRALEQIEKARDEGADIRGFYYWSLTDNFEWAEGFEPRFGLYTVDYDNYTRSPTQGAEVLGEIAGARRISKALRDEFGGEGPLTAERGETAELCSE